MKLRLQPDVLGKFIKSYNFVVSRKAHHFINHRLNENT